MAKFIKANGTVHVVRQGKYRNIRLEDIQMYCGGYVDKLKLGDGRIMFVNAFVYDGMRFNKRASEMAGVDVFGNVVICTKSEI